MLDELQAIADQLRPYTAEAMKIEVAPWIRDYVVDMDDLYTELALEKIHNKPFGTVDEKLKHYRELFENSKDTERFARSSHYLPEHDSSQAKRSRINSHIASSDLPLDLSRCKGEKILMKGDPGMGKTTQYKKISWDWAMKLFTYFHVVFFVFLKLVKTGDVIESVIIKQNPYMKGLEITEQKLRDILQFLGSRCLLILDGLDEHALGTNEDVLSILRGEKHLKCNIIITSRPHIPREIERYFPTVVRVEGFTRNQAEQFASKILNDKKVIKAVLNYNPTKGENEKDVEEGYDFENEETGSEENYAPIHKCPILLSFMCLLAREDDIDFSNTKMHTGEIYTRMVRCLYKKYVIRKGLFFDSDQFKAAVTKIGKLALKTLLSGDPLLQRSEVIKEVGPEAFDYGLLIGHEDAHMLLKDETADIFVTFPHRSIQEFLGSLYLIWMLNKGKEIQSLLGVNCGRPIFLTNTLFLQFCLWFLRSDQTYFLLENRHKVYQCMKHYCVDWMNRGVIDLRIYPAFHSSSFNDIVKDKLRLSFLTDILVKCNKTSRLDLPSSSLLDSILGSITHILKDITSIGCGNRRYCINIFQGTGIVIEASNGISDELNIILKHYTRLINEPNVHLYLRHPKLQSEKILCPNVKKLHLIELKGGQEIFESSTKFSRLLTHFCLQKIENRAIMKREINQLASAVKKDNLLNLSHLAFLDCNKMEGKLSDLFKSAWPHLKHLDLKGTLISEADLEFLSLACNGVSKTLPNLTSLCLTIRDKLKTCFYSKLFVLPWLNLKSFHVDDKCTGGSLCRGLSIVKMQNKLPNLTCLTIDTMLLDPLNLYTDKLPNLKVLHLHTIYCASFSDLQGVMRTERLSELKLCVYSSEGNVPSFLTSSPLGQLTTLILSDRRLNSKDFASLAQAKLKGYLPLLKNLDIHCSSSEKYKAFQLSDLKCLFDGPCTWNGLVSLDIRNRLKHEDNDKIINCMNDIVSRGFLPSLQKLGIDRFENRTTHWNRLEKLTLIYCEDDALRNIADAVCWGYLPVLHTLCVKYFQGYNADFVRTLSQLGVSCHRTHFPFPNQFNHEECVCETQEKRNFTVKSQ